MRSEWPCRPRPAAKALPGAPVSPASCLETELATRGDIEAAEGTREEGSQAAMPRPGLGDHQPLPPLRLLLSIGLWRQTAAAPAERQVFTSQPDFTLCGLCNL